MEREEKLLSRKHWISFGVKPKGSLIIDDGARDALLKGGKSLLLPGVISWEGHFKKGDILRVLDRAGHEIARGITNYAAVDIQNVDEKRGKREVIHCNDLVLSER